jgi:hypothetical protein
LRFVRYAVFLGLAEKKRKRSKRGRSHEARLLETKHVPGSAAGTMGGKERMNSISALKVAVSENLVYGLIFLPLWFRNKDVGLHDPRHCHYKRVPKRRHSILCAVRVHQRARPRFDAVLVSAFRSAEL